MATSWPLVGRRHELDVVTAALEDGVVAGVVLSGAAGVGKTRLADECLARAGSLGFATARATATQATSDIPFGALAPLLPVADPEDRAGYSLQWAADALAALAGGRRL